MPHTLVNNTITSLTAHTLESRRQIPVMDLSTLTTLRMTPSETRDGLQRRSSTKLIVPNDSISDNVFNHHHNKNQSPRRSNKKLINENIHTNLPPKNPVRRKLPHILIPHLRPTLRTLHLIPHFHVKLRPQPAPQTSLTRTNLMLTLRSWGARGEVP